MYSCLKVDPKSCRYQLRYDGVTSVVFDVTVVLSDTRVRVIEYGALHTGTEAGFTGSGSPIRIQSRVNSTWHAGKAHCTP